MPGQYIPLFFQAGAGMGVALGIPAKLASDLVAVRRAPVCRQQIEQCPLVLVGLVLGSSHAKNLASHPRQMPTGTSQPAPAVDAVITARLEHRRNSGEAIKRRRGSRPVARSDVVVEFEFVGVGAEPEFVEFGGALVVEPGLDEVVGEYAAFGEEGVVGFEGVEDDVE